MSCYLSFVLVIILSSVNGRAICFLGSGEGTLRDRGQGGAGRFLRFGHTTKGSPSLWGVPSLSRFRTCPVAHSR